MVIKTSPINFVLKNGIAATWAREGKSMEIHVSTLTMDYMPDIQEILPPSYKSLNGCYEAYEWNGGVKYRTVILGWTNDSPLDSSACPTTRNLNADNGVALSSRQEANKAILNLISKMVIKYPELHFGQIMQRLTIVIDGDDFHNEQVYWCDEYSLESTALLDRVLKTYKELEK